jgi:hypothetical protein
MTLGLFLAYIETRFLVAERLFMVSAFLLLLLAVPGFVLHWAFLRRLRAAHPETWRSLGQPSVVYYGSRLTGWNVMRFLRNRSYRSLGDPYLDSVCRAYVVCATVYTLAFLGLLSGSTLLFVAPR